MKDHGSKLSSLSSWTSTTSSFRRSQQPLVGLQGGEFVMGSEQADSAAADGEGPVRSVFLSSFAIETFAVTSESIANFVSLPGYQTEAEKFGWS